MKIEQSQFHLPSIVDPWEESIDSMIDHTRVHAFEETGFNDIDLTRKKRASKVDDLIEEIMSDHS